MIDRRDFLPDRARRHAGADAPISIGHGQTNSQPTTVDNMLGLLDARPGHRVLDVGSGSAWSTARLAEIVGPRGRVFGVERVPELVEFGRANLAKYEFPWASIHQATPVLGMPDEGPFDRILVSAMADELPQELVAQLAPDGIMVIPVAGTMLRVRGDGTVTRHGGYLFVPLITE